jgi:hypothetical protein
MLQMKIIGMQYSKNIGKVLDIVGKAEMSLHETLYNLRGCTVGIVTCWAGNTSNNLRILHLMPDLLVMCQAELQLIITIAISLQSLLKSSQSQHSISLEYTVHCVNPSPGDSLYSHLRASCHVTNSLVN